MRTQTPAGHRVESTAALTAVCLALLLVACSREAGDWRSTQGADTIEAYERFIEKYPQSELAAEARARARQLAEERDWQLATSADTAAAYQQFLSQYPEGKWAQEARVRIENFNVMEASAPAPVAAGRAPASESGSAVAPAPAAAATTGARQTSPPAVERPVKPAAAAEPSSGHRVQLGAFSSEAQAGEAWRVASARFAALRPLEPEISVTTRGGAPLYRLQTTLRSEAEARDLCRALQAGGQACLYVPPQ